MANNCACTLYIENHVDCIPELEEASEKQHGELQGFDENAWEKLLIENGVRLQSDVYLSDTGICTDRLVINFGSKWSAPLKQLVEISKLYNLLVFTLTYETEGESDYGFAVCHNGEIEHIYTELPPVPEFTQKF
jgi:hypothetical protein